MTALQNALEEFSAVNVRDNFHRRQPGARMSDVRAEQIAVVSENLTAFASARDTDVKLFLMDGGQRTRRRDDQHFIHRLALGGVRGDGVAVRERALFFRNDPAIGQHERATLNGLHFHQLAIHKFLLRVRLQQQLVPRCHFQFPLLPHVKQGGA